MVPGPLARHQARQIQLALRIGAGGHQRFDGAVGQQRAQRERQVGRVEHFDARRGHQLGQTLAAEGDGMLHALPAALAELVKGLLEARAGRDHAVL
jgi:hypothetical protein